ADWHEGLSIQPQFTFKQSDLLLFRSDTQDISLAAVQILCAFEPEFIVGRRDRKIRIALISLHFSGEIARDHFRLYCVVAAETEHVICYPAQLGDVTE